MDSRGAKSSVKPLTESGQPEAGRGPKARGAWHLACRAALAACVLLMLAAPVAAQRGGRGAPQTARDSAPIDLTGYWVSVLMEDWKLRMVTPPKGVFDTLTLNAEGRRVGNAWDPARDDAAGEQCRAYGAGGIMRLPGRLHVTWQDASTLRVDTDAGTQSRLFRFGTSAPAGEPSWQGHSVAQWQLAPARRGGGPRLGNLKAVTTNLRPGYLRKNGAPYSKDAVVTEYFDLNTFPNQDVWLTVTVKVDDPTYLTRPYLTTSDFKKLPDATGWNPTPCSSR